MPTIRRHHRLATAALAIAVLAAACVDDTPDATPDATPSTGGGFGAPAAAPGEFGPPTRPGDDRLREARLEWLLVRLWER